MYNLGLVYTKLGFNLKSSLRLYFQFNYKVGNIKLVISTVFCFENYFSCQGGLITTYGKTIASRAEGENSGSILRDGMSPRNLLLYKRFLNALGVKNSFTLKKRPDYYCFVHYYLTN